MHGTRPTDHPIARLRLRGGVIRQRLIAAAWPGLAELALKQAVVQRSPAPSALARRPRRTVGLPVPPAR